MTRAQYIAAELHDSGAVPQIDPSRLAFGAASLLEPDAYLAALEAERAGDELHAAGVTIVRRARTVAL